MYRTGIILIIIKIRHSKTRWFWCLFFSGSGFETFIRGKKKISGKLVVVKRKGGEKNDVKKSFFFFAKVKKSCVTFTMRVNHHSICFNIKYFYTL